MPTFIPVGPVAPCSPGGPSCPRDPLTPGKPFSPFLPIVPTSPGGPGGSNTSCLGLSGLSPFSPGGPVGPESPLAPFETKTLYSSSFCLSHQLCTNIGEVAIVSVLNENPPWLQVEWLCKGPTSLIWISNLRINVFCVHEARLQCQTTPCRDI